jgi:hypothetical protein
LHQIDYYPEAMINLEKLEKYIPSETIFELSFTRIINMFRGTSEAVSSRFLTGIIRESLHFCPSCLREDPYFRLLWKIEGVSLCRKHGQRLIDRCHTCRNEILYKDVRELNKCPYCNVDLGNTPQLNEKLIKGENIQIIEFWEGLLFSKSSSKLSKQDIALRALFIINDRKDPWDRQLAKNKIGDSKVTELLQTARGTTVVERSLHISFIQDLLINHNLSASDFLNLRVPDNFKCKVLQSNAENYSNVVCIAPWCSSFQTAAGIIVTGARNVKRDGSYLVKYFVCRDCGCEYAANFQGLLIERIFIFLI